MKKAADDERYEEAAKLRDEVAGLRKELAGSALTIVGEQKVGVVVEKLLSAVFLLFSVLPAFPHPLSSSSVLARRGVQVWTELTKSACATSTGKEGPTTHLQ